MLSAALVCLPSSSHACAASSFCAGFSLAALEELVAENKKLKYVAAKAAQRQQDQQQQQLEQQQLEQQPANASAASTVAQLEAELRQLQLENGTLRQQLRLSESLRRKGRKALTELKQARLTAAQAGAVGSIQTWAACRL